MTSRLMVINARTCRFTHIRQTNSLPLQSWETATSEGFPGSCKTAVLCDLIARVTTGRTMPLSKAIAPPGNALLLNAEDPVASLRLRLALAEADMNRVHIPDEGYRPQLPDDISELERFCVANCVRLVVLDPLASYSLSPLSSTSAIRRLMDQLNAFAQRAGLAVVGVRHWTKSDAAHDIYRAAGSYSITAAIRSELIVAEDPVNHRQRVIAQLKNNLAPLATSIVFRPDSREEGMTISWISLSQVTVHDLIDAAAPRDRPALEEAK